MSLTIRNNKKRAILFSLLTAAAIISGCASPRFGTGPGDITMDLVDDKTLCAHMKRAEAEGENNIYTVLMPTADARKEAEAIKIELKKRNPDWPWDKIDSRKIQVGMTEAQAVCAWGSPIQVNHASYGDQWVYPGYPSGQYLYFENGVLNAFN